MIGLRRSLSVRLTAAAIAVAATAALAACGGQSSGNATSCDPKPRQLVIATGTPTGVYATLGAKLADLVSANTPLQASLASGTGAGRSPACFSTGYGSPVRAA